MKLKINVKRIYNEAISKLGLQPVDPYPSSHLQNDKNDGKKGE